MEAEAISNPGAQGAYMHKNRLQEFAQKASMHLPVYQTFNEGSLHNPQLRSSVIVDGATFVSPCTFVKRKEAEQYVAKFALENILMKIKHEGVPLIHNDAVFCKTILHEYVAKMKMELPTYTTSKSEGSLPSFITSVVFEGKTYRGGAGRSKREAEQLGARTVVEWILGQSNMSIVMAEIIKSKAKLFNTFCGAGSIVLQDDNVPLNVPLVPAAEHSIQPAAKNSKAAENTKEAEISKVCPGSTGGRSTAPTLQQENQLEGTTIGPVNYVTNDYSEQIIQVKQVVPSEGPTMLLGQLHNSNPGTSGKRPRRKTKSGSNSKKMRANK